MPNLPQIPAFKPDVIDNLLSRASKIFIRVPGLSQPVELDKQAFCYTYKNRLTYMLYSEGLGDVLIIMEIRE